MKNLISLWIMVTMLFYLTASDVHAKIIYNRKNNTITITGSHTFLDIAHADTKNKWGVFRQQGNKQFETDAKITIGVIGGRSGELIDDNKQLSITDRVLTGEFQKAIGVEKGTLRLGFTNNPETKEARSGCDIIVQNPYKAFIIHGHDPKTCIIELYSLHINNKGSNLGSVYIPNGRIWDGVFYRAYCIAGTQDKVDIHNLTILQAYRGLSHTIPHNVTGLKVIDPAHWGLRLDGLNASMSIRDAYFLKTKAIVRCACIDSDISLIDVDTDNWALSWHKDSSGSHVYRKYSFNLRVADPNGVAISGATVKLHDNDASQVFGVMTNPDGSIPEQIVTRSCCGSGYMNLDTHTEDDYSPHTLTVTKSGYKDYKVTFTLIKPVDWLVPLKSEDTVSLD